MWNHVIYANWTFRGYFLGMSRPSVYAASHEALNTKVRSGSPKQIGGRRQVTQEGFGSLSGDTVSGPNPGTGRGVQQNANAPAHCMLMVIHLILMFSPWYKRLLILEIRRDT